MKFHKIVLPLLAAMFLASGCQHGGGIRVSNYPTQSIDIQNKKLARSLDVDRVHAESRNGFLTVQINLENTSRRHALDLEYRVQWLDENGIEVPGPAATWTRLSIPPREHALAQGIAPNRDVPNYLFLVRER